MHRTALLELFYAGRFSRYRHLVGRGRFKSVYKGFDEKQGIDIAWSKIEASNNHLSHEQMKKIVEEISYGLGLDHPHVIRVRRGGVQVGSPGCGGVATNAKQALHLSVAYLAAATRHVLVRG